MNKKIIKILSKSSAIKNGLDSAAPALVVHHDLVDFYESIDDLKQNSSSIENRELYSLTFIYCAYYSNLHTLPQQRLSVQSLFLTINTIYTSAIGYILSSRFETWIHWSSLEKVASMLLPYIFIVFVCYVWFHLLQQYDDLNYAFIALTAKMEDRLPIRPLSALLKATKHFNINYNLGMLTKVLPVIFAVFYTVVFIYVILVCQ